MTPLISVAVPTLTAGETLTECLRSLDRQTFQRFDVVVVDNSGIRKVQIPKEQSEKGRVRVIYNERNVGFGAAVLPCFIGEARGGLVRVGPPQTELDLDLWLLTDADLRNAARVSAFMTFAGAELAKLRPRFEGE